MRYIHYYIIIFGLLLISLYVPRQLVFKRKYNSDGSIQTFKARLIVKNFRQKKAINYFDTYASMDRITSIRVLLALSSIYNLHGHQINVKTTFLND